MRPASGTTAIPLTLATVNGDVGTYQGITVNAKGLVTSAANQKYLVSNQPIAITGDVNGTGSTTIASVVIRINGVPLGLTTATAGNLLIGSGADWASHPVSGDIALSSAGVTSIGVNKVQYGQMQKGAAATLVGNPTGAPADLVGIVLGTNLSFTDNILNATGGGAGGTVTTTGSPDAGKLAAFSGPTSITNGDLSGDISTAGTLATTLKVVNADVGTWQGITVNAKGLATGATAIAAT